MWGRGGGVGVCARVGGWVCGGGVCAPLGYERASSAWGRGAWGWGLRWEVAEEWVLGGGGGGWGGLCRPRGGGDAGYGGVLRQGCASRGVTA